MLRVLTGALVVAVLGAVTLVGAQSSSPNVQQITRMPETTLTGCLKTGPTPDTYILEAALVKQDNAAVQTASRSTGTSGAAKRTYTLAGMVPPGVKLSDQANHQVEVVGVVIEPAAGENKNPKMNMRTLKQVAARCQ